ANHETGQVEAAARYAMRAVALLDVLRDRVSLARAENSLAQLLITRGDFAAARELLERGLELTSGPDAESGRSNVLLSRADLATQEGNVDEAYDRAREALAVADRLEGGANVAEAPGWLGRVADRGGRPREGGRRARRRARRGRPRVRAGHRRLRGHGHARTAAAMPWHLRRDPRATRGARQGLCPHEGSPAGQPPGAAPAGPGTPPGRGAPQHRIGLPPAGLRPDPGDRRRIFGAQAAIFRLTFCAARSRITNALTALLGGSPKSGSPGAPNLSPPAPGRASNV